MRTSLDCLVCFMRQARATGKLATDDYELRRQMIDGAGRYLAAVDLGRTPPENAVSLYGLFARILQERDPFAKVKKESNAFALALRDEMEEKIVASVDPLLAAIRVAIGGNIIDHAAQHVFDAEKTMSECLEQGFPVDDYPALRDAVMRSGPDLNLLYLCDNCGEIVFDALLIRQLQQYNCTVTAAVRGLPIINDATMEDALSTGLDRLCRVISNGTDCPGTPLSDCSDEFRSCFQEADIIISKGMGNYETLSEVEAPLFFLFTVKCSEVAKHITGRKQLPPGRVTGRGEMICMAQHREALSQNKGL